MPLPPDSELKACLEVIRAAILDARVMGWQDNVPAERLADLMDAVHNIPSVIENWDESSIQYIKEEIAAYDEKWSHSESISLRSRYEQFACFPPEG